MLKLANNLSLPVELCGQRTAVFGISGSGKSNTATVIVEEAIAAGEQVVLIDPKGEAWGLLSLAGGKASNLDVIIFGEPRGHIAHLTEHHGPQLADFVVESGRSVALSLLGFESDSSERRFVASFLRQLYRRKSRMAKRARTLVVIDEAALFIPESAGRGHKGEAAELAGACQKIVRQGRAFGVGTIIVDQRPQDVAKRVVTQCDTIVCHRLTHNLDRDTLAEWVRGHDQQGRGKEFLDTLASLKPGEAWVWSPAREIFKRVQIRRRHTFDSGASPDGTAAAKVHRKEIDLAALGKQLAELVDKAKADDPRELRMQIAELSRQLKSKPAAAVDQQAMQAAGDRAVKLAVAGEVKRWQAAVAERDKIIGRLKNRIISAAAMFGKLGKLAGDAAIAADAATALQALQLSSDTFDRDTRPAVSPNNTNTPAAARAGLPSPNGFHVGKRPLLTSLGAGTTVAGQNQPPADGLTEPQQRVLDAIGWWESIGVAQPRLNQVGAIALMDCAGGYFRAVVGPLSVGGLVERLSGRLQLTDAGRQLARLFGHADSLEGFHAMIRERVRRSKNAGGKTLEILDIVIAAGGESVTVKEIGERCSMDTAGGYFRAVIGPLATLGLIDRKAGNVTPTDVLFPQGLA